MPECKEGVRARGVQTLQGQGVLGRFYDERVVFILSRGICYIYGSSRARSRLPGQDSAVSAVRCRAVACLIALPLWAGAIRKLRLLVYIVATPCPYPAVPQQIAPSRKDIVPISCSSVGVPWQTYPSGGDGLGESA